MNRKHQKILAEVFHTPLRADVAWDDVEGLFRALGADVSEGEGSRVRVALGGVRAVFHRLHPHRILAKGAVRSVQRFLKEAGVEP